LFVAAVVGCTNPSSEAKTDIDEQAIDGTLATTQQWMLDRAAAGPLNGDGSPECTATRIAPNFLLTALHCQMQLFVGKNVTFYSTGPGYNTTMTAKIVNVTNPPGTNWATDYYTDSNGQFADLAVVQLDRNIKTGAAATMQWAYPGSGSSGFKVGCGGLASGVSNTTGRLLAASDTLDSGDDSGGGFHTTHDQVDPGDSGGPFYYKNRILGTLWGTYAGTGGGTVARYTSVPAHLDWILGSIGYQWSGAPPVAHQAISGNVVENFATNSQRVCQYACEQHSDCVGYNFSTLSLPGICQTFNTFGGVSGSSTITSGLRFATRSSAKTGNPAAYARFDGVSSVVNHSTDNHVHEFYSSDGSNWNVGDLFAFASADDGSGMQPPAIAGKPSVFAIPTTPNRGGANSILYRTSFGQIIQIYTTASNPGWHWRNLTNSSVVLGGLDSTHLLATGDPKLYLRSDGTPAIVYRWYNEIWELAAVNGWTGTWTARSLTTAAGAPFTAGEPSAYVRADGLDAVVYRGSDANIYEIASSDGTSWGVGSLTGNAGKPAIAAGDPFGYVRVDGVDSVVFRGTNSDIWELYLQPGFNWQWGDLSSYSPTPLAAGNPVGYVRSDGTIAIVFRSVANDVIEITPGNSAHPWISNDLSVIAGGPSWAGIDASDPMPYVRSDGGNAVVFLDGMNHMRELSLHPTGWTGRDLTHDTGENP